MIDFTEIEHRSNKYYDALFHKYGRSHLALGWIKGRQLIRFSALTRHLEGMQNTEKFTLLDFGCGLGDLFEFLLQRFPNVLYFGVDINLNFIESNLKKYTSFSNCTFKSISSIDDLQVKYDHIIASGVFNYNPDLKGFDEYVVSCSKRLDEIALKSLSIDFMSEYVDFKNKFTHHQSISILINELIKPGDSFEIDSTYLPYEFIFRKYKC